MFCNRLIFGIDLCISYKSLVYIIFMKNNLIHYLYKINTKTLVRIKRYESKVNRANLHKSLITYASLIAMDETIDLSKTLMVSLSEKDGKRNSVRRLQN